MIAELLKQVFNNVGSNLCHRYLYGTSYRFPISVYTCEISAGALHCEHSSLMTSVQTSLRAMFTSSAIFCLRARENIALYLLFMHRECYVCSMEMTFKVL